jgi:quinolinate synthase
MDIFNKIKKFKKKRNAVILPYFYQDSDIQDVADFMGNSLALAQYAQKTEKDTFIIVTEPGVIHQMEKITPHKNYITVSNQEGCACNECPHMRLNTLEKMVSALENLKPQIQMSEGLRLKALKPLERMLALS